MTEESSKGWATAKLNDVVSFALGGDWGKGTDISIEDLARVRVIRGTEFRNWRDEKGASAAERHIKVPSLQKRRLQKGDLVLEVSGGGPNQPVGRTILIDDEALRRADAPLVCSNFFRLLRLQPEVDCNFISHFLSYAYARGAFNEFQTETTNLRNLNVPDFLEKTNVALAPLHEQRRIVAKLEKLLDKVDASQRRLEKIPVLLKRFRRSVFAAACAGRLTADWRKEEQAKETAAQFVRRVQEERKAWFEQGCAEAARNGHRKPKQPKNAFVASVDEEAQGLPDDWCVTHIGDISDCLDHIRVPINKTERLTRQGTIPYYGANGQVGLIDEFLFEEDLVLVVEDETFIGREIPFSYVIRGKSWVNNHAHVLRPLSGMPVDYLNISLSYYDFTPLTSGTTGRRKLNQEALLSAPVWIAPLPEQQEIVRRVEGLFALADQLQLRFTKARDQVDKLTPSLLARAFRGELVPQDPNDEPAEILLERIKGNRLWPYQRTTRQRKQ